MAKKSFPLAKVYGLLKGPVVLLGPPAPAGPIASDDVRKSMLEFRAMLIGCREQPQSLVRNAQVVRKSAPSTYPTVDTEKVKKLGGTRQRRPTNSGSSTHATASRSCAAAR
jgi:hypothetical protein